jgi:hypothetical protein
MSLLDAILNSQDGAAVQQLGAQFGLGQEDTTAALSALVPALAAGVHQNAQSADGLDGLMAALSSGQHQQYVDNPSMLGDASTIADGKAILGHVFGSREVSRQVAAHAAGQTGLSPDLLKQMLPMVAALVMGAMSRHAAGGRPGTGMQGPGFPGSPMPGGMGGALGGGGDLISMITATLGQAGAMRGGPAPGGMSGGLGDLLGRFLGR